MRSDLAIAAAFERETQNGHGSKVVFTVLCDRFAVGFTVPSWFGKESLNQRDLQGLRVQQRSVELYGPQQEAS